MPPPAKPVGITEFWDSSTKPDISLFWTGTDIADSANAGNLPGSSGATGIISEPEGGAEVALLANDRQVAGMGQAWKRDLPGHSFIINI